MAASKDVEKDAAAKLAELEKQVAEGQELARRGWVAIGSALKEIRRGRLYLLKAKGWAAYCDERWNVSEREAERAIQAADVVKSLVREFPQVDGESPTNLSAKTPLPAVESHARALVPVPEHLRGQVWADVWQATGGHPTAKAVEAAVAALAHGDSAPAAASAPKTPAAKPATPSLAEQAAAYGLDPGATVEDVAAAWSAKFESLKQTGPVLQPVTPSMPTATAPTATDIKPDPELATLKQEIALLESVVESLTEQKKELEKQLSALAARESPEELAEQAANLAAERDHWKARAQQGCGHDAPWHQVAEAVAAYMEQVNCRWDLETGKLVQIVQPRPDLVRADQPA